MKDKNVSLGQVIILILSIISLILGLIAIYCFYKGHWISGPWTTLIIGFASMKLFIVGMLSINEIREAYRKR